MYYLPLLVVSQHKFWFNSGCHKLVLKAVIFNDVAIVTVKGNDYRIHFSHMSKYEAIKLLRNADLTEKTKALYNLKIHYHK